MEKEDGNKHLNSDHHEDQIQYFEKTKLKIIDILSKVAFSYVYSICSSNSSKRKSLFESTILKLTQKRLYHTINGIPWNGHTITLK